MCESESHLLHVALSWCGERRWLEGGMIEETLNETRSCDGELLSFRVAETFLRLDTARRSFRTELPINVTGKPLHVQELL